MSSHISEADFRNTIKAAVVQKSIRYSSAQTLTFRWEGDDTEASKDTVRFQALLASLKLPKAHELILKEDDTSPGWTVEKKFQEMLRTAKAKKEGRSIVIIHYAGHGYDSDGTFFLAESLEGPRKFDFWLMVLSHALPLQYDLNGVTNVDTLFILDCCYAHVLARTINVAPRIVEILAATTEGTPRALAPPAITFTAKLQAEITARQRAGHRYVEMATVIETLRSNEKTRVRPCQFLKLGVASICLPFTGLCQVDPTTIQPTMRAVFSVDIAENMTKEELTAFVNWIRSLPNNVALSLDGIYFSSSTYLIMNSAYSVYSKMAGIGGIKLLKEATGVNMRPLVPTSNSPEKSKENVPISKQPQAQSPIRPSPQKPSPGKSSRGKK